MMADKSERGVVGVAESVVFDKNDDHAPEGVAASDHLSCYAPVCRASRPAADFLASGSVTSFFPPAYPCSASPQDVAASSVMRFPSQLVVSAPR